MQDQVQSLFPFKFMYGHHKAVLVFVVNLHPNDQLLGKPAGIISDNVAPRVLMQILELLLPYHGNALLRHTLVLENLEINFVLNVGPIRHLILIPAEYSMVWTLL